MAKKSKKSKKAKAALADTPATKAGPSARSSARVDLMKKLPGNTSEGRDQTPPYREFELAVWSFVKGLGSSAKVTFDHKVPDRDTGIPRQVDVWIEAKLLGHWPVSIVVSCKAYARKLNIGEVDTFISEVWNTRASCGVIYSTLGFTAEALAKAKKNDLSCCRLYRDQPADVPESLSFWSYCCQLSFNMSVIDGSPTNEIKTWSDVFDSRIGSGPDSKTILQRMESEFRNQEDAAVETVKRTAALPADWAVEHTLTGSESPPNRFVIRVVGHWRVFRGRLEAHFLNGSYCFKDQSFVGSVTGPWVDMASIDPGPAWEETTERELPSNRMLIVKYHGGFKEAALEHYGPRLIRQ